jgi:alginate production protein
MTLHPIRLACRLAALAAAAGCAPAVDALSFDATLRSRAAFEANGARDLGLTGGGNTNIAYLDLSPRLFITFDPKLTAFVRMQGFLPTDAIPTFDDGTPAQLQAAESFVALNEAWVQFNGLTSYPNETLRIGRQLIREDNGDWVGINMDAIRWSFDTTLFRAVASVMYPFSSYRTDDLPVPPVQRDRLYGTLNVGGDWAPEQRIGARVMHASDRKGLQPPGSTVGENSRLQSGQLTWIGVYANNGYNIPRARQALYYSFDLTYLTGTNFTATATDGVIANVQRNRLGAFAGTGALRWKPLADVPVSFGTGYTYSSGGGDRQYQQSGIHNNNNFFAGNQTLTNRYSNVVRAQLGNLHVVMAHVTYNLGDWDASLVYQNFRKDKANAPITTNNVTADPVSGSKDVGNGLEFLVTRFLGDRSVLTRLAGGDDDTGDNQRSSVRLRASVFDPGAAYGPGVDKFHYRIILETTLWVF